MTDDARKLLPRNPTDEMIDAAMSRYRHPSDSAAHLFKTMHRENFRHDYIAMFDAFLAQPAASAEDVREACAKACKEISIRYFGVHGKGACAHCEQAIRALDLSKINVAPQREKLRQQILNDPDLPCEAGAAPLTVEQIERIKAAAASYELEHGNVGPLRNWWADVQSLCDLALRSLAPGFVSVPEIVLDEAENLCNRVIEKVEGTAKDGRRMGSVETYAQCKKLKAMLAAGGEGK